MTTEVAKRETKLDVVCKHIASPDYVARLRGLVATTADAERFKRAALTAIQTNKEVTEVKDVGSIYLALDRCVALDLLPDGREAALVKVGDRVTLMPMIGGLRKIAASHGFTLTAYVVHSCDEFSYELGQSPTVTHKPPSLDVERGNPIGAYAVAHHPEHGVFIEVMGKSDIEHVRKSSRSGSSGPWSQHWGEMARKTVARRLFKQLPLGALADRDKDVLDADDEHFDYRPSPLDSLPVVDPSEDEPVEGEVVDADEQIPFGE